MEEHLGHRFGQYVLPSVLSMVGLSCYVLADTFFISNKVGSLGLAALNFAIPMYSAMNGTGLMLGVGGATKFAIHRARGETEKGNRAFSQMIFFGILISLAFSLVGWFGADQLAVLLGADESVKGLTAMYIAVLLTFAPCFILNNIMVAFARNDEAPKLAMIAMLVGSGINVLLDYVFIYPMGMGMFGAALATGISPTVSLLIVVGGHNLAKKSTFHLHRCKLSFRMLGECCSLGISAFIGEVSSCVVILVFNLVIFGLTGNVGVAAYGIVVNSAYVVISICNGVTQGCQPLISEYYARDMETEKRKIVRYGLITAFLIGVVTWIGVSIFAPEVSAIFNSEKNPALDLIAIPGLRLYFLGFWLTGINLMLAATFAAVERTVQSFLVSISRGLVALVVLVLLFSRIWGMTGVWLSFPGTEIITFALAVSIILWIRHRRKKSESL